MNVCAFQKEVLEPGTTNADVKMEVTDLVTQLDILIPQENKENPIAFLDFIELDDDGYDTL